MIPDQNDTILEHVKKYFCNYYESLLKSLGETHSEESLYGDENWINALKFILYHLMFRGRKDKLSLKYSNFYWKHRGFDHRLTSEIVIDTKKKLDSYLSIISERQKDSKRVEIKAQEFANYFNSKITEKEEFKLNLKDIEMISGLLNFQIDRFKSQNDNIIDYLLTFIKQGKLIDAYKELIGISQVGDKLASFTLRDVVLLSNGDYKIELRPYDYLMLFPVDTWVKQGGNKILRNNKEVDDSTLLLKIELIRACEETASIEKDPLSPLKLNAGIWYHYFNLNNRSSDSQKVDI